MEQKIMKNRKTQIEASNGSYNPEMFPCRSGDAAKKYLTNSSLSWSPANASAVSGQFKFSKGARKK